MNTLCRIWLLCLAGMVAVDAATADEPETDEPERARKPRVLHRNAAVNRPRPRGPQLGVWMYSYQIHSADAELPIPATYARPPADAIRTNEPRARSAFANVPDKLGIPATAQRQLLPRVHAKPIGCDSVGLEGVIAERVFRQGIGRRVHPPGGVVKSSEVEEHDDKVCPVSEDPDLPAFGHVQSCRQ